ncbi:hypothetical protein GH844_19200 [Bacillus thuringiensis]|nr:hypothetical protein [Bacillus thuringiensis]
MELPTEKRFLLRPREFQCPTDSSHCSWIPLKAKVARSECEVAGASDLEALFASREEVKPPNILATVAGFH